MHKRSDGFTITELIIVIVVIAILAAIIVVSFADMPKKTRNAKRQQDIANVKRAFDLFKAEGGTIQCILPYCTCTNMPTCNDGVPGQIGFLTTDDMFTPGSSLYTSLIDRRRIFVKGDASKWPIEYMPGNIFPKDPCDNSRIYFILISDASNGAKFEYHTDAGGACQEAIDAGIKIDDTWQ